MTRLIDADALARECAEYVAPANRSDFEPVPNWNDAMSLIGSAQTVEAIPIEWLVKQYEYDNDIHNNTIDNLIQKYRAEQKDV